MNVNCAGDQQKQKSDVSSNFEINDEVSPSSSCEVSMKEVNLEHSKVPLEEIPCKPISANDSDKCCRTEDDCLLSNKIDEVCGVNLKCCSEREINKLESSDVEIKSSIVSELNLTGENSLFNEKIDRLKCNKTEEQLIENVQFFYPEIEISKATTDVIVEGLACILKQSKNVFYNPVQEFNRDLSVAALSVFAEEHQIEPKSRSHGKKRKLCTKDGEEWDDDVIEKHIAGQKYNNGIVILEALSATGLRSIRYAKEVPGVKEIVANDISKAAVESIKKNIDYNKVGNLVSTSHNDASLLMYTRKFENKLFDVIDLDPYGCPSRFLDAAVQCVRDGGLLLITCTDMAVLAGNSPETCYVKYGAISLRNPACHEMALRITLQCIESHANRYGRYIVPQLSFSADFYIRVIVKIYTSPAMCKRTTSKLTMIYQCVGCQTFKFWPLGLLENSNNSVKYQLPRGPPDTKQCPHCNGLYYQGGPIWSGPLHNTAFIEKMLLRLEEQEFNTEKRMEGMLELIREELSSSLLYYKIDSLCSKVHCDVVPRNKFVSALLHAGYKVTLSHAAPNSLKTDAPSSVIWDIIRCWVKTHPVNPKRLTEGSVAEKILNIVPKLEANFDLHPEVMPRNEKKILRYQQNPQPFWGPGTRDKTNCCPEERMKKSHVRQNRKHKREHTGKVKENPKSIEIIEIVMLTDEDSVDSKSDDSVSCIIDNICVDNGSKHDSNTNNYVIDIDSTNSTNEYDELLEADVTTKSSSSGFKSVDNKLNTSTSSGGSDINTSRKVTQVSVDPLDRSSINDDNKDSSSDINMSINSGTCESVDPNDSSVDVSGGEQNKSSENDETEIN